MPWWAMWLYGDILSHIARSAAQAIAENWLCERWMEMQKRDMYNEIDLFIRISFFYIYIKHVALL